MAGVDFSTILRLREETKILPPAQPTEKELRIFAEVERLVKNGWIYCGDMYLGDGWYDIKLVRDGEKDMLFRSKRSSPRLAYTDNGKTIFFT